jgi:hypothetical protein
MASRDGGRSGIKGSTVCRSFSHSFPCRDLTAQNLRLHLHGGLVGHQSDRPLLLRVLGAHLHN